MVTAPIDASALRGFNGEIALRADTLIWATLHWWQRVCCAQDRSRLVAELREIQKPMPV